MVRAAGFTTMLSGFATGAPEPSLTCTVKFEVPAAVGVPAIVSPLSDSPAGSDPVLTVHVYEPDPPVATKVCEYGALTVPLGREAVEMVSVAGFTTMANCLLMGAEAPSLSWTVKPDVPAAVGVPAIVAPFSERPAGSEPEDVDQVYVPVPPVAA